MHGHKIGKSSHLTSRIFKIYIETLTTVSHIFSLNNTLFSQGHRLTNVAHCGNHGHNKQSKGRGEGEEPRIAQVLLVGHPAVASSQFPLFPRVKIQSYSRELKSKKLIWDSHMTRKVLETLRASVYGFIGFLTGFLFLCHLSQYLCSLTLIQCGTT